MSLNGASVEEVLAVIDLEAVYGDRIDVRNEFVVVARGRSGSQCRYASGPGIAPVPAGTRAFQDHFDFLARDAIGDLVADMREDGYDGPDPLARCPIEWRISPSASEALSRLGDGGERALRRGAPPHPRTRRATHTMDARVRDELERLLEYARAVTRSARRFPDRTDIRDGGMGYVGGALTTMLHLGLISDAEHQEWQDRLTAALPPSDWIGG